MLKTDFTRQGLANTFGWVPAPATVADSVERFVVVEAVGGSDLPLRRARKKTYVLHRAPHYIIRT